jgi:hypothetical protein
MKIVIVFFIINFLGINLYSQNKLPIIEANSFDAYTKIGKEKKKDWYISPKLNLDVFTSNKIGEIVTFYTDIDSISFIIEHEKAHNFVILVNKKDSAFTQIKYAKSYLDILKEACEYDFNDNRKINDYAYNKTDDPILMHIKNKYNLDSIAGENDELSKIINILLWVNKSFKHDGTKPAPSYTDMIDLMSKSYNNINNTLHCGAMAWVLVDCYLAIGLKAKQVVCYPKDSTDFECHSTVAVFSNNLNKWLFMDPSNGLYLTNEKNEILSFEEFRFSLINGKEIWINKEAKDKSIFIKEEYLSWYMPKNFYAFQCFSETNGISISNVLLPVEYKGEFTHTRHNYPMYTNNPKVFWVKP